MCSVGTASDSSIWQNRATTDPGPSLSHATDRDVCARYYDVNHLPTVHALVHSAVFSPVNIIISDEW